MTTNNHPANDPISLERLHQIHETLSKAAAQSDGGNLGYAIVDAVKVIDGAIAAFDAEPVAWQWDIYGGHMYAKNKPLHMPAQPLYTHPAPILTVPEPKSYMDFWEQYPDMTAQESIERSAGWNACRTAMLQAEPVSNHDELPLDYLQGHKDGLEWAAQLAEANHPQTGDWLYDDPTELAKAIRKGPDMPEADGNSPVTPDTWIPVSERMPDEIGRYWCYVEEQNSLGKSHFQWNCSWNGERWWVEGGGGTVTHWMPLAEPPRNK